MTRLDPSQNYKNIDLKMSQRNFNTSVCDVVKRLDSFFMTQTANKPYGDKDSLITHIDQAIFSSSESKMGKLTSMNELEIANEVCMYCARQKAEYVRYCVFDAIFSMTRHTAKENRLKVLAVTGSLAIALESTPVLECMALWLATAAKDHAIYLATCLEKDFCDIMPESAVELKICNKTSERFTTMLITAFCAKYNAKTANVDSKHPPPILLDVVHNWVLDNPKSIFCVISQIDQVWHTVLTTTRNPTESLSLSPLAGLIEWTTKLPFAPSEYYNTGNIYTHTEYNLSQSRLHYSILVAITLSQDCRSVIKQGILGKESDFQLWNKSNAHALVGILLSYSSNNVGTDKMTEAVDRFAQISQVAMTYDLLTIAKEQFQSLTDPLPQTRLLELVAYGTEKPAEDIIMS